MKLPTRMAAAAAVALASGVAPAQAQFFPGPPPVPMCAYPWGVAPCGPPPPPVFTPPYFPGPGAPPPSGFPPPGFPGAPPPTGFPPGPLPPGVGGPDAAAVAAIAQRCGGDPICMAGSWAPIELSRCVNGIGVPGGCLGPGGDLGRVITNPGGVIEDIGKGVEDVVCGLFGC